MAYPQETTKQLIIDKPFLNCFGGIVNTCNKCVRSVTETPLHWICHQVPPVATSTPSFNRRGRRMEHLVEPTMDSCSRTAQRRLPHIVQDTQQDLRRLSPSFPFHGSSTLVAMTHQAPKLIPRVSDNIMPMAESATSSVP